jgi:hypothetical protein
MRPQLDRRLGASNIHALMSQANLSGLVSVAVVLTVVALRAP